MVKRDGWSPSELARACGVKLATVRYYERTGMIPFPARTAAGHRIYAPETARQMRFIRHAQQAGFTLREIRELLALRTKSGEACGEVRRRAENKIAEIGGTIKKLEETREALQRLASNCREGQAHCHLLNVFDSAEGLQVDPKRPPVAQRSRSTTCKTGGQR